MVTIIAECGINHNGDVEKARKLVFAAKKAGADAVKFQLFTDRARPQGKKFILSEKEWGTVMGEGREISLPAFFSVFDFESIDLAKRLGAKWVKLSFVERRNSRLIERCCFKFERKFVSVDLYGQYNSGELKNWEKLYCPNNGWSGFYPTKDENIEWERYQEQAKETGLGWSDHCQGWAEAVMCAVMGAKVIEKHFKIDDDCPDAVCSLGPERFKLMVDSIRRLTAPFVFIVPEKISPEMKEKMIQEFKERGHKTILKMVDKKIILEEKRGETWSLDREEIGVIKWWYYM